MLRDLLATSVIIFIVSMVALSMSRKFKVSVLPFFMSIIVVGISGFFTQVPGNIFYIPTDGIYYSDWALHIYEGNTESGKFPTQLWPGKGVWPLVISAIYKVFGPVTIAIHALNVMIVGIVVIILQKTTKLMCGYDPKFFAALIFLTSPSILLFGPSSLRESLFWLGGSLGILSLSYLWFMEYSKAFVSFIAGGLVLMLFRPDMGLVMSFSILFVAGLFVITNAFGFSIWSIFMAVPFYATLLALFIPSLSYVNPGYEPKEVNKIRKALSSPDTNTGFQATELPMLCDFNETTGTVCDALITLPKFFLFPSTNSIDTNSVLIFIVLMSAVLHFILIAALALSRLFNSNQRFLSIGILFIAMIQILTFSVFLTNYGIILRFRTIVEVTLLPLALSQLIYLIASASNRSKLNEKNLQKFKKSRFWF